MAVDNKAIAENVLAAVGGAENVQSAEHCMTRLRLVLNDKSKLDEDAVKKVKGVIGAQWSGTQYQVIIGQNVNKVYPEFAEMAGVSVKKAIDENLDADAPKEKLTAKAIGNNILNYVSRSMVQMIPVMIAAGLFKALTAIVGPSMLNLVTEDSDLYVYFNWIYDAGFYFLPIYLGYCAAKTIGATPLLGAFLGGILIDPTLTGLATAGERQFFSVLGMPALIKNYSQSVLPILMGVALLYVVEKFFKKHMPSTLSTIFTPFCTIFIVAPITLVALAPLGQYIGEAIAGTIFSLGSYGIAVQLIGMAIIGGLWQLIVVTGMHVPIIMLAINQLMTAGFDNFVFPSTNSAMFAVWGVVLGAALKFRNKEEKGLAWGYLLSAVVGGVTEPGLFGIVLRFKKTIPCMIAGGAAGAILCGLTGVTMYMPGTSNILCLVGYIGDNGTMGLVFTVVAMLVSIIVAAILTYLFAFSKEDLAAMDEEDVEALEEA